MSYSQAPNYWTDEPGGKVMYKGASRSEIVRPIVGEVLPPVRLSDPHELPAYMTQAAPIHLDAPAPALSHTGHIRQTDDALTNAKASLLYSKAIGAVAALGVTGILFLAWLTYGGDLGIYFGLEIVGVSGVALVALVVNRGQGLRHSASGIAHHELNVQAKIAARHAQVQEYAIDSHERIALHAIDAHAELIKTRWQLEAGQTMKSLGEGER